MAVIPTRYAGDLKQDGDRRDGIGEFLELFMPVAELDLRMGNMKAQRLMPRFSASVSGWTLGPLTEKQTGEGYNGLCVCRWKEGGVDGNRREKQKLTDF